MPHYHLTQSSWLQKKNSIVQGGGQPNSQPQNITFFYCEHHPH